MSRIGRAPIAIPAGVEVVVDGSTVTVKGAKGTLTRTMNSNITITKDSDTITVTRPNDQKENRSLHGLTRTLIANMIEGVSNGFKKELEINGIGYRAEVKGNALWMKIGFSHDVIMEAPEGVTVEVNGNKVTVSGADKQKVGQFAAEIREKRPPEPYKGKGIKYVDEYIRRKEGKAGKGK